VQGWEELMLVVESSIAGGRKETALAAIHLISTVLQVGTTTFFMEGLHMHGCALFEIPDDVSRHMQLG
jgi:hypothetical protein